MREDLYDRTMNVGITYHVYNRGVAREPIFRDDVDRRRFLETLSFYLDDDRPAKLSVAKRSKDLPPRSGPPLAPIAEPIAYCLMPNHFHLALKEIEPAGISRLMRRALLSYTRYFNTRHRRVGSIFQGTFRFVPVTTDEQLLHLTRYIHLNPYVARITKRVASYTWSSYSIYQTGKPVRLCNPTLPLQLAGSAERYETFVSDFADYAMNLALMKDHTFDEHD